MRALRRMAPAREAFARVADTYDDGNALLVLERPGTEALLPPLRGRDVLDVGAGHAHYARLAARRGARAVVALDVNERMLRGLDVPRLVADAASLPLAGERFDVAVAALVLSYLDRARALREVARVLRRGGRLVVSELHGRGARIGAWRRTFRGPQGEAISVDAPPPPPDALCRSLEDAGFVVETVRESMIDDRLRPHFLSAGRGDFARLSGLPLLVHIAARRASR
jgi:SAM-dependent methyltransferase